ncbi:hypothetical protein TEA_002125 [Camellia sinensis var. sinensis]|uniref:Uncharacterized protein n=1 Tax=Camellia sinensis var. sinensis TaxID=542762 RepID=A0A4S4DSK0_CAMSN|nr:hypothetical protein TEA_002125 [Camellia sinensis var. sinensis]
MDPTYGGGLLYQAKGLRKEALRAFWHALDVEATHVPSLVSMAVVLRQLGGRSSAVVRRCFLTEALRLDRMNASAWYNLGLIYKDEGEREGDASALEAAECFEAAIVLEETAPDDESLRRWKEKLLGCVEEDLNEQMEPEVIFHSIGIISDDFGEISTPIPVDETKDGRVLFTLKEGSEYRLKLAFTVLHNIVSGLMYTNTVWKGGLRVTVDQSKGMLGTFAPQREPYVHTLDEDTAPSGVLARGTYTANLKLGLVSDSLNPVHGYDMNFLVLASNKRIVSVLQQAWFLYINLCWLKDSKGMLFDEGHCAVR